MPPPFRPPVPEPLHGPDWVRPPGNLDFRVTQDFYNVNPEFPVQHRALDLGNTRLGAPVTSPAPGKVLAEGYLREPWSESSTRFGTGNYGGIMVVIDHGDGWYSALAHLADTVVNAGQPILTNQLLGHLGDTGSAKGAGHVHWDLYKGRPTAAMTYAQRVALKVDPWPLLEQNYTLPDTSAGGTPDMRYSGTEVAFVDDWPLYRVATTAANFRTDATTQSPSLALFPAGTGVRAFGFTVKGQALAAGDRWLPALMYTGTAYESGFFHTSTVELVPITDETGPLQAALDSANQRTATVKNVAVAGIKSHAAGLEQLADKITKL